MDFATALKLSENAKFITDDKLEQAFEKLVLYRDLAQDGLHILNKERMRRTEEEVKRLRAEVKAKA